VPRAWRPAVHFGVDAADEEGGDAVHGGEVAASRSVSFQPGQVGLDDLGVAGQGEDEGDVDAAALGDHGLNSRHASGRGGDLHEQVRLGDPLMQAARRRHGRGVVMGELRRHLDGREPVTTPALVIDGPQQAKHVAYVADNEFPVGVRDASACGDKGRELLVVGCRSLDRPGEDGGIGSHTRTPSATCLASVPSCR